jgi:hypothetical protein
MAGAGYKLFQTGDVLTAAQVNTYLNEQTVMVFANAAARTSALTSVLAEGMVSYLQDTNVVEVYNGTAWVGVSGAGDVTEVQAGTGISVASGTGPVPIVTSTVATTFDAKGDLVVGTGADTFAKLTVGTNGHTLVADSAETTGLKWAAPAAAGFVGANAYRTTTDSLTADTVVIVSYPSENIDTDGFHSTSVNSSRMTVPAGKGGKYLCIVNMFATGGSSRMIMYPYKNGANVGGSPNWSYVIDNRGYGNAGAFTGVWMIDLVATDYVEVGLYSATNTATLQESTFQFIYLGA